jgi:hypothetical protein
MRSQEDEGEAVRSLFTLNWLAGGQTAQNIWQQSNA